MFKINLIFSICIFAVLLGITSVIKNQTRIIEKNIYKIDRKLATVKRDLNETELDFFYLSSPNNLHKKIKNLALVEYIPMDFFKIYSNLKDFKKSDKKLTILKINHEKKTQKK